MTPPGSSRRILMTTDAIGGVWNYALELCRGLGAHGYYVVLATMGPRLKADQRAELTRLHNVTLCESEFRLEWMDDPWSDVERAGEWLLELEQRFSPELIHLNGYVHAALGWQAPTVVVGHSCVASWWNAVRGGQMPSEWDRYRAAVGSGLRAANQVVAPSHAMLHALRYHYGEFDRAKVIPNGRNPEQFAAEASKQPFVLAVGRLWDEAKNVQALADVAPEVAWPIRFAGDSQNN
jgi:glycogen(starch) synthase